MKQKVIEFLQNLPKEKYDQFNEAFELYRKSEGKNFGVERSVNAAGFSERGLENLLYDLQKLHGITDVEKSPLAPKGGIKVESEEGVLLLNPNSEVEGKTLSTEGVHTNTEAVHTNTEGAINDIDVNDNGVVNIDGKLGVDFGILKQENENLASENEDLQDEKQELEEENEELKDELETLKSLPKIDAKSIRVEFPFLNDKDCPDEFKILVADKITSWNEYLNCQVKLHEVEEGTLVLSEKELADLAALTIDNFRENQKIYDELNAYAETGKVLGLHPIFKRLQLTREVEEMTADELHKYKGSSAKYFSVNKTALAKALKAKDTVKQEEINSRVTERELKLALVNKKLGINLK